MKEAMDFAISKKKMISLTLFNKNLKFGGTPHVKKWFRSGIYSYIL
jgi:hypothetical protein